MRKAQMIEALTERVGLNEVDAEHTAQVIDEVLANEESQQLEPWIDNAIVLEEPQEPEPAPPAHGELFKDAIVKESTGLFTVPATLGRRQRHRRRRHGATA